MVNLFSLGFLYQTKWYCKEKCIKIKENKPVDILHEKNNFDPLLDLSINFN